MSENDPSSKGNEGGDPFGFSEAFSDKGENEGESFKITDETTKEDVEGNLSGYLEANLDNMDSDILLSSLKEKQREQLLEKAPSMKTIQKSLYTEGWLSYFDEGLLK